MIKSAFSPFIIIQDLCYTEITNNDIKDVAPGQYINKYGVIYNSNTKNFIHPVLYNNGYMYVYLYKNDNSKMQIAVHRLLMILFEYNSNYKNLQVNHKDLNKQNNSLYNLEWTTPKENIMHASINNAIAYGNNHGMSKLTENDVESICRELEKGLYRGIYTNLSNKYNVDINTIYDIAKGRSWTRVSKNFDINYNQKLLNKTDDEIINNICIELSKKRYRGQLKELSEKYNVSTIVCYDIAHGNIGKEISSLYGIDYNWSPNLTEEDVENICYILKNNNKYGIISKIAKEYDVSYSTISAIANHRNWTYISDKYQL